MKINFAGIQVVQDVRESDLLPLVKLLPYLQEHLGDFLTGDFLEITQFSAGASNLTYRLNNGKRSLILRRPPVGTKAKSAHDMVREHNVLKTIEAFYSLSPKPVLLCDDPSVIGDPFFVMQEIDGLKIDKNLPIEMTNEQKNRLCTNYVDGLVALHQIDISHSPLSELGKPNGYIERQVEGWQKRFEKAKTDDVSSSESIYHWLQKNLILNANRDSSYQSLIHNDYKFDNLILSRENPEEIIGVLDWEMTTLGDPFMDLGCSLAYWVEANDSKAMQAIRMMPTHLSGMMTRQQIFDYYCKQRQISEFDMVPYYVFGLFRLAVIAQQIYYRFYHGQTDNPKFKDFGQLVNILLTHAKSQIKNC